MTEADMKVLFAFLIGVLIFAVVNRMDQHMKRRGIIYLTPRDIRGRYLLMERIRRTLTRR